MTDNLPAGHDYGQAAFALGYAYAKSADEKVESPLSGEWADGKLPVEVYRELGTTEEEDECGYILDCWESGYEDFFDGN